jgi:DNA invertase Pin-like site-specific DNA recombinase
MKSTNKKDPKSAVAYIGISKPYGGTIVVRQIGATRKYAEKHGYDIKDFYIELGSNKDSITRPTLRTLFEDAAKRNWGTLIVKDRTRLTRNDLAFILILDELDRRGVKVVSMDEKGDMEDVKIKKPMSASVLVQDATFKQFAKKNGIKLLKINNSK